MGSEFFCGPLALIVRFVLISSSSQVVDSMDCRNVLLWNTYVWNKSQNQPTHNTLVSVVLSPQESKGFPKGQNCKLLITY